MENQEVEFITTTEACELLSVSKTVIKRMADDGSLETWKTPGGHRRLKKSSVLKLLAEKNGENKINKEVAEVKALVIDDDVVVGEIFTQLSKNLNIKIQLIFEPDGYSGLLKAGQDNYDVIFVDLDMPNLDGYSVINTLIQQANLNATIMVITAFSRKEINLQRLPEGIPIIAKPLDVNVLTQFFRYESKIKNACL